MHRISMKWYLHIGYTLIIHLFKYSRILSGTDCISESADSHYGVYYCKGIDTVILIYQKKNKHNTKSCAHIVISDFGAQLEFSKAVWTL